MAATRWFALLLCTLLMVSRGASLASGGPVQSTSTVTADPGHNTGGGQGAATNSSNGNQGGTGGHETAPITTLPIVTWKWTHVSTPYLVALWVLVSWICKLSES
ncbi:uncharacterized protein ACO6RY_01271 [Pungitius sinensis]